MPAEDQHEEDGHSRERPALTAYRMLASPIDELLLPPSMGNLALITLVERPLNPREILPFLSPWEFVFPCNTSFAFL